MWYVVWFTLTYRGLRTATWHNITALALDQLRKSEIKYHATFYHVNLPLELSVSVCNRRNFLHQSSLLIFCILVLAKKLVLSFSHFKSPFWKPVLVILKKPVWCEQKMLVRLHQNMLYESVVLFFFCYDYYYYYVGKTERDKRKKGEKVIKGSKQKNTERFVSCCQLCKCRAT